MMLLRLVLALIFLYSCSSQKSSDGDKKSPKLKLPEKALRYTANGDFHQLKEEFSKTFLSNETLGRFSQDDLDDIEDSTNVMTQVSSLCLQKKFNEGFALLDKSYAKYKNFPSYWNAMGSCYLLSGQNKTALLYYNKALKVKRNYAPAMNNIGLIFLRKGQDQKALVAFEKAAQFNQFALVPKLNLSMLLLKHGQVINAHRHLKILYNQSKSDRDVLGGLALISLISNNPSQAVGYYSQIPEKYWENYEYGLFYSYALFLSGSKDKAKDVLDDIRHFPDERSKRYLTKIRGLMGFKK